MQPDDYPGAEGRRFRRIAATRASRRVPLISEITAGSGDIVLIEARVAAPSQPPRRPQAMTTFAEEFKRHLESGESFEQTADWYFSSENDDVRWSYTGPLSPAERRFFDYFNNVVFTKALEEMRAACAKRLAVRRALDLAARSS
jgi:hypothetical protein